MTTQPELLISGLLPRTCEARTQAVPAVARESHASRSDLRATVAMLGLFGLGLGALVVYTHSFMPMPAEIGLEHNIDPPHPRSHELQPPSAAGVSAEVHACAPGPYPR